jgi:hypothetical protein
VRAIAWKPRSMGCRFEAAIAELMSPPIGQYAFCEPPTVVSHWPIRRVIIFLVSTLYSFWWDICMDWGLGSKSLGLLRERRIFTNNKVLHGLKLNLNFEDMYGSCWYCKPNVGRALLHRAFASDSFLAGYTSLAGHWRSCSVFFFPCVFSLAAPRPNQPTNPRSGLLRGHAGGLHPPICMDANTGPRRCAHHARAPLFPSKVRLRQLFFTYRFQPVFTHFVGCKKTHLALRPSFCLWSSEATKWVGILAEIFIYVLCYDGNPR